MNNIKEISCNIEISINKARQWSLKINGKPIYCKSFKIELSGEGHSQEPISYTIDKYAGFELEN